MGNGATGNQGYNITGKECVIRLSAQAAVVNGTFYAVGTTAVDESQRSMYIFRLNTPESRTAQFCGDFYYMKIWEGDSLVRDFVPVVKNDGVIALLDRVSGTLYDNMKSGEGLTYTE